MKNTQTFQELAGVIRNLKSKHSQVVVGIDGGSGAGKSTFACLLQKELLNSVIIHIDDFYKGLPHKAFDHKVHEVSPNFDWERLEQEVFEPLRNGKPVEYQVYNWHTNLIDSKKSIPTHAPIIIEGIEVTQNRFKNEYDFKIWVECNLSVRLERGVERDGETMRGIWENDWLPFDEVYSSTQDPKSRANLVIDGLVSDYSVGKFTVL